MVAADNLSPSLNADFSAARAARFSSAEIESGALLSVACILLFSPYSKMPAGIDLIVLQKHFSPTTCADGIKNLTLHSTEEPSGLPESVKIAVCSGYF
ncbi:MAG: hypothetical protein Q8Q81_04165 [Oxalobacteraceae bacterium]|nr:hypothetical protein [Oxalobacteraceae bacterium]